MEHVEIAQSIHALFETACQELLATFNCEVKQITGSQGDIYDAPLACIDAGSDEVEVDICLELPVSVLALTYPVPDVTGVDEEALEDWISELSNQLIGRLKTKLYSYKIEITLGLPNSYYGVSLDSIIPPANNRFSVFLDVDGEICAFHLGLQIFKDDISFDEVRDDEDIVFESEIELF